MRRFDPDSEVSSIHGAARGDALVGGGAGHADVEPAVTGDDAITRPEVAPGRRLGIAGWLALLWMALVVFVALAAPLLPIPDPNRTFPAIAREGPGAGHLLGGDAIGRDVFSRVVWGTRSSMIVAVAAVGIGLVVGGFLGLVAGYFRGRIDSFLVAAFDALLAFPQLVLALALVAVLAAGDVSSARRTAVLVVALGIVSIPILGRITRANTLVWAEREFVVAARALGARHGRIMVREILPNVLPAMASIALLGVAVVIVAEGGLAVLGVGVQLPTPSWGNMIAEGRGVLRTAPHVVFAPSAAIFLTVLALNYLGDVVRARFDVRESML